MKPHFHLDDKVYADLLKMLNAQHFNEHIGEQRDMDFIKNDLWLYDTAVIENLWRRRGMWEIHLLFAHFKQPLTFLSRSITQHVCPKRAAMMANFMRRLAAKDQRGTLEVNIEDFKFPKN
jgi:hypothetical protein